MKRMSVLAAAAALLATGTTNVNSAIEVQSPQIGYVYQALAQQFPIQSFQPVTSQPSETRVAYRWMGDDCQQCH